MSAQLTLLPELPGSPTEAGVVYLMTDGLLLKWGYVSRRDRLSKRKGELRSQIIGWAPGTKENEDTYLRSVKQWLFPGTEWFRLPDSLDDIYWLYQVTGELNAWNGHSPTEGLLRVIAANLRMRRAA